VAKYYTLRYRPPASCTLPRSAWTLVERPQVAGYLGRQDLPESIYRFGVVTFDREISADEIESFELLEITSALWP